jgi:hypothetical protein
VALPGQAFLALWNDCAPGREDYDTWHTREHVPERLKIPGILAARRYAEGSGPLPSYFTLYALTDISILTSQPYLALLQNPTSWSRSMRPDLRHFLRLGCRTIVSQATGLGGMAAVKIIKIQDLNAATERVLNLIVSQSPICGAHLGLIDSTVPDVPFSSNSPGPVQGNAVLVLEGYELNMFERCLVETDSVLASIIALDLREEWSRYRISFEIKA